MVTSHFPQSGVATKGIGIKKELDNSHVLFTKCEALWGKKKKHNGFKYESCGDAGLIAII